MKDTSNNHRVIVNSKPEGIRKSFEQYPAELVMGASVVARFFTSGEHSRSDGIPEALP